MPQPQRPPETGEPAPPGPDCLPEAAPAWIVEGESLSQTLGCASGMTSEQAGIEIAGLPPGATFDGSTGVLSWTPALDQAAVWTMTIAVAATGEEVELRIGVADAWHDSDNVPIVDPTRYPTELGLPVFFLDGIPDSRDYIPATLVHGGRSRAVEAKARGATSFDYPKRSFTFSFPKEDKFDEPSKSFFARRKINLHAGFDDNSHVRNHLAFRVWNAMDPGHIQVHSYPAVVYLDGRYWGHYTVIDHIDGFFMEDHGYDQQGDMFKAVSHSADFAGGHDGFEKTGGLLPPGEPGAWKDLDDFIGFVDRADHDEFREGLATFADVRDYEDWWVFVTLIYANDSAGKNNYHFHDDGPFRFIPWDYNASFGQSWSTNRCDADADEDFLDKNRLFQRFHEDETFAAALRSRYAEILGTRVPKETVLEWIDEHAAEIERSALRDERRWDDERGSYFHHGNDWREEVEYIRQWTKARWEIQESRYTTPAP